MFLTDLTDFHTLGKNGGIDEVGEAKTYFLFHLIKQNEQRNHEYDLVKSRVTLPPAGNTFKFPMSFTDGNQVGLTYDPVKKSTLLNAITKYNFTHRRTKHCNKNVNIFFLWVTVAKTIRVSTASKC